MVFFWVQWIMKTALTSLGKDRKIFKRKDKTSWRKLKLEYLIFSPWISMFLQRAHLHSKVCRFYSKTWSLDHATSGVTKIGFFFKENWQALLGEWAHWKIIEMHDQRIRYPSFNFLLDALSFFVNILLSIPKLVKIFFHHALHSQHNHEFTPIYPSL